MGVRFQSSSLLHLQVGNGQGIICNGNIRPLDSLESIYHSVQQLGIRYLCIGSQSLQRAILMSCVGNWCDGFVHGRLRRTMHAVDWRMEDIADWMYFVVMWSIDM
eukprot:7413593-Ditylum_brightwellii.AAC.1